MIVPRSTVRISNIPRAAIAEELLTFFETFVGPVFACEIASAHRKWMSLGFGRVQFESQTTAENACILSSNGRLPVFQRSNLALLPSPEDILPRSVDARNRVGGGILHAGILGDEGRMEVFASWEGVVLEFMPERKKMEIFLEDGGENYKLVVMFEDVTGSNGCCLGGKGLLNSMLLQDNAYYYRRNKAARHGEGRQVGNAGTKEDVQGAHGNDQLGMLDLGLVSGSSQILGKEMELGTSSFSEPNHNIGPSNNLGANEEAML